MPWHYVPEVDAFTIYHQVQEEQSPSSDFSFSNALGHAIAGGAGSAVSNVLVYPLALVVTRLQAQHKNKPSTDEDDTEKGKGRASTAEGEEEHYAGVVDAFRTIAAHEGGLPALYGGVVQDTLKSMAEAFLFFLAYNALYDARRRQRAASPAKQSLLARALDDVGVGMAAGALTKALTFPLQQVVTRKQRGGRDGAAQIIRRILARDGLLGLWSGYGATIILTLNPSLAMSVHAALERAYARGKGAAAAGGKPQPGAALTFLFAATGKAVASCAMYPVSLAKTRAQTRAGGKAGDGGPAGVMRAIGRIAQAEGVGALYSGVGGEVLKGFFSHGLTMLMKQRIQGVVIALYCWMLGVSKGRRPG